MSDHSSPLNQHPAGSQPAMSSLDKVTRDISPMLSSAMPQSKATLDVSTSDVLGRASVPKETIHHYPTPQQSSQHPNEPYQVMDAPGPGVTFYLDNGDTVCTLEDDPCDPGDPSCDPGDPGVYPGSESVPYVEDPMYSNNNIFPATAYLPPLTTSAGSIPTTAVTTTSCVYTGSKASSLGLPSSSSRMTPPNVFPFETKGARPVPGCLGSNNSSVQSSKSASKSNEEGRLSGGEVTVGKTAPAQSSSARSSRERRSDSDPYLVNVMSDEFRDIVLR